MTNYKPIRWPLSLQEHSRGKLKETWQSQSSTGIDESSLN